MGWSQTALTVQAKLGIVGKVGVELQKERAEISVHDIDLEVVHHRGCSPSKS